MTEKIGSVLGKNVKNAVMGQYQYLLAAEFESTLSDKMGHFAD